MFPLMPWGFHIPLPGIETAEHNKVKSGVCSNLLPAIPSSRLRFALVPACIVKTMMMLIIMVQIKIIANTDVALTLF